MLGPPTRPVVAEKCPRTFALRGEGVRHGGVTRETPPVPAAPSTTPTAAPSPSCDPRVDSVVAALLSRARFGRHDESLDIAVWP
jgi:hypothetical protein